MSVNSIDPSHSAIVNEYCRRTPTSARLARQGRDIFPSGITHDARHAHPHPIYVERAEGSHKWDVDGHRYVDYSGGHGAMLLGHGHPKVVEAVQEQIRKGTHYAACHQIELRWGQLIQQMVPCAQRIRLTSSGTEATLLALRLARAHTGKTAILRFTGHYHGWHDHVAFGVRSHFDGTPTPGVLPEIARQTVMAPAWDFERTRQIIESRDDLAAAIIEPTGSTFGQAPVAPEFLESLRRITAERGIVLIFDEVISGFRCSPGGAQAVLGITPDMTTLGKIVGGSMPGAAVVGAKPILDLLDFEHAERTGQEKIAHHGTFNATPISGAAAIATLEIVRNTDVCERANNTAHRLRARVNEVIGDARVPWISYGTFSGFHIFLNPHHLEITADQIESGRCDHFTLTAPVRSSFATKLRLGMLVHGVDMLPWPGGLVSAVHTDNDLDQTARALAQTIRMLRDEGEIEGD